MRTLNELILFPLDRETMTRADADPTPEEQALVINAYARERYGIDADFKPFQALPWELKSTYIGDNVQRWNIVHEWALLWFYRKLREP